ncbi:MAG: energy transducer TonB [Melioribacteraceae bacterium]
MNSENQNNDYGAFELKRVYNKNYLTGLVTAVVIHLMLFFLMILLLPHEVNEKPARVKILKYAELGPPPSIMRENSVVEKVGFQKQNFGKPVPAKKGESVTEFEVPKEGSAVGDVKIELPKAEIKIEVIDETFYVAVDMMPEPNGGMEAVQRKVIYPPNARRDKIEGKVIVKAFIDEAGSVRRAEVVKGIGSGCDEAAIAAVMNTRFKPGRMNGKVVRVQMSVALEFKL